MSTLSTNNLENLNDNILTKAFTFFNGDSYDGEYKVNRKKNSVVKEGQGVYQTDDFNIYNAIWDNDKFSNEDIDIKYNNNTHYKGQISAEGLMNGQGIFTFPDGSMLEAQWKKNKPISHVIYKESHGYAWTVLESSDKEISFTAGNHFWNDMLNLSTSSFGKELNVSPATSIPEPVDSKINHL